MAAFYFAGGIEEIRKRAMSARRMLEAAARHCEWERLSIRLFLTA